MFHTEQPAVNCPGSLAPSQPTPAAIATVGYHGDTGKTVKSGRVPLPAKEKEAMHARWCLKADTSYNVTTFIFSFSNTYQLTSYLECFLYVVPKFWTDSTILNLPCRLAAFIT